MTKSRPPKRDSESKDIKQQRDAFVQTFFKRGAELTEELIKENARLRAQITKLETDNAKLRTQLKSDHAIRDALRKIEQLETEKEKLLSQFSEHEEKTSRFTQRYVEVEDELANLANLYVATDQLHASLEPATVVRQIRELLAQLVGARVLAIYVADDAGKTLAAVASEGIDREALPRIKVGGGPGDAPAGSAALIERVHLTGIPNVTEGSLGKASMDHPAAVIPMRIDDRALGVIVVYSVLPQKERFVSVDFELFKLLGPHAATALASALLFAKCSGPLPGLDVLEPESKGARA
jgi:hypothetical protein